MKRSARFRLGAVAIVVLGLTQPALAQDTMTAAEHAAAADGYQAEAKQAQDKAAEHELTLRRYENASASQKALVVPKTAMINHCRKLVDNYKEAASEASALAEMHRDAAAAGQGS